MRFCKFSKMSRVAFFYKSMRIYASRFAMLNKVNNSLNNTVKQTFIFSGQFALALHIRRSGCSLAGRRTAIKSFTLPRH